MSLTWEGRTIVPVRVREIPVLVVHGNDESHLDRWEDRPLASPGPLLAAEHDGREPVREREARSA